LEVTINIKRNGEAKGKTYQLKDIGKSKKGTYKIFSPAGDNADLPVFSKTYIKAKRGK